MVYEVQKISETVFWMLKSVFCDSFTCYELVVFFSWTCRPKLPLDAFCTQNERKKLQINGKDRRLASEIV